MPDILLIQPPIRDFYLTAKRTIPHGLACIASALMREGFSVQILDALATRKARRMDPPPEMSYLRGFYPGPDTSPFSLFHEFRHFGCDFEEIGRLAGKSGAFMVGISSLFSAYSDEAIQTAEAVRRHCPGAIIVLGGHHPTEMPEDVLRHKCVDYVIRGEGEPSLPLLALAIREAAAPDAIRMHAAKIPGIAFRNGSPPELRAHDTAPDKMPINPNAAKVPINKKTTKPPGIAAGTLSPILAREGPGIASGTVSPLPAREGLGEGTGIAEGGIFLNPPSIIEDLDDAPFPATELIDTGFYQRRKKPCAVVVASRGCPLKCSYCSVGGASWSRFRLKSTASVMEELNRAVFYAGARFIDFEDENISFDRKWFLALLESIQERFAGIGIEFRAMNGLFPPTLDDEVIRAMKDAGFTALNLSLCTTCQDQLKRFRRPDVRPAFEKALQAAQKYGLETVGYIIVGAPGQFARDSVSDLLYLASQKVLAGVSVFYPAPGSADFEKCRSGNLLPHSFSLMRATALPVSDTTTREESATLLRLGRILNFMKSLTPDEWQYLRAQGGRSPATGLHATAPLATKSAKRRAAGMLLLSRFLADGIIRGITPEGKIFEHRASRDLCLAFRDGIPDQNQ
ncbi:MAG: radical SAM protein [Syntrophobacteraceae bacterium]